MNDTVRKWERRKDESMAVEGGVRSIDNIREDLLGEKRVDFFDGSLVGWRGN